MLPSSDYVFWFTVVLHLISSCIISLVLLCYLIEYCCHSAKTSGIRFFIKSLTVIGSIACLCCTIFSGLSVYIDKDSHNYKNMWYQLQNISHCFIDIMTYSVYIYRLHLSFYDTAFKISNLMLGILISFVCLDVINYIIECLVYRYNISWIKLSWIAMIGGILTALTTILCLWLFNINLFRIMIRMKTSILKLSFSEESVSITDDKKVAINTFNDRQKMLINRIVRNALLCSITIMFWVFERIAWLLFVDIYETPRYYDGLLVAKCCTATASMVDASCMLFTFRFASNLYGKFCSCCDQCCQRICKECAVKYQHKFEINMYR